MERLLEYFVPERYVLNLVVNKETKTIGGVVEIVGKVLAEIVKFHAVGLTIEKVLADGKEVEYEVEDGLLTLKKVPKSVTSIKIEYNGSLNENMEGAYLSTYEYEDKTEKIVATRFESHYAREAFPCIDEPAAKAVFEMKLTVPEVEGEIVLYNTPVVETKTRYVPFEEQESTRVRTYEEKYEEVLYKTREVTIDYGLPVERVEALKTLVGDLGVAIQVAIDDANAKPRKDDPVLNDVIGKIVAIFDDTLQGDPQKKETNVL